MFAGIGAFTYGSPEVVLGHLDSLDWVAMLPDADPRLSIEIRAAGKRAFVWQPDPSWAPIPSWGHDGEIVQAEDAQQLQAAIAFATEWYGSGPIAIIGNPTIADTLPDVPWLNECYENANPKATILGLDYEHAKRSTGPCAPCFGMYHEGDPGTDGYVAKLPLQHYLDELEACPPEISRTDFSFWTAEQLDDADWAALTAWHQKYPR